MEAILVKSAGFIFVILLGFFLKRVGVFKVEDAKVLNKAMLYVTLPAILINAFREFKFDASLFVILMIGFVANIILMIVGRYVGKNSDGKTRAIYMLSLGGYNIGSFSLPFVQNFFPVAGLISVVMFDIGNTLMCAGGTYSFAAMEVDVYKRQVVNGEQIIVYDEETMKITADGDKLEPIPVLAMLYSQCR